MNADMLSISKLRFNSKSPTKLSAANLNKIFIRTFLYIKSIILLKHYPQIISKLILTWMMSQNLFGLKQILKNLQRDKPTTDVNTIIIESLPNLKRIGLLKRHPQIITKLILTRMMSQNLFGLKQILKNQQRDTPTQTNEAFFSLFIILCFNE